MPLRHRSRSAQLRVVKPSHEEQALPKSEVFTSYLIQIPEQTLGYFGYSLPSGRALILISVESPMPRLKALLFVVQALQIFFLVVTVPALFMTTQWFSIPLSILDFSFKQSPLAMYITFGVVASLVVLFVLSAILVSALYQKEDSAAVWPLRFLRASVMFLSWILYVPMLGSLVDVLDCRYEADGRVIHDLFPTVACWGMPHAIPSALALVVLVIFLATAAGVELFAYARTGFDSRSRGRFDLFAYLCKGLLVVAARLLTRYTQLRSVIMLACTTFMWLLCLFNLPYHKRLTNVLYTCLYWVCFLAALETTLLWFAFPDYATSWVSFLVLLGTIALTTPLVAWLVDRRYVGALAIPVPILRRILATPAPQAGSTPGAPAPGSTIPGPRPPRGPTDRVVGGDRVAVPVGVASPPPIEAFEGGAPSTNPAPLATALLYLQLTGVPSPSGLVPLGPAVE
ncbi:hypothetical protein PAPYR_10553 [Paratrimastix pyriformis]|uniref:Uncharacterized protein n=1 Tax=Paratrimastix pyriformis TaxID=342808 RepID=A0ABQ8U9U8_9EUKA|nr:hypothetical protein PAPYR_10553 [Paratrimastix pyriformis]